VQELVNLHQLLAARAHFFLYAIESRAGESSDPRRGPHPRRTSIAEIPPRFTQQVEITAAVLRIKIANRCKPLQVLPGVGHVLIVGKTRNPGQQDLVARRRKIALDDCGKRSQPGTNLRYRDQGSRRLRGRRFVCRRESCAERSKAGFNADTASLAASSNCLQVNGSAPVPASRAEKRCADHAAGIFRHACKIVVDELPGCLDSCFDEFSGVHLAVGNRGFSVIE